MIQHHQEIIAIILIAFLSSSLGCFILWQRMAYFGDSISHAALLGVAIGLIFSMNLGAILFFCALIFSFLLFIAEKKEILTKDATLGVVAHAFLAIAIILLVISKNSEVELEEILLGDISMIGGFSLLIFALLSLLNLAFLFFYKNKLILATIDKNLAKIKGLKVDLMQFSLMFLISYTTLFSLRAVGALIIASFLIIPASAARQISKSPFQMLILSIAIAVICGVFGCFLAQKYNLPIGASAVLVMSLVFVFCACLKGFLRK